MKRPQDDLYYTAFIETLMFMKYIREQLQKEDHPLADEMMVWLDARLEHYRTFLTTSTHA